MADSKQPRTKVQGSPELATETFHDGSEQSKRAFLASFSALEDKQIVREVDRRLLLLMGMIYLLKKIDYINAATVKVLQVGQPRNILKEPRMTADQYNRVQSIYFISYIIFEVPCNLLLKTVSPRNWQTRIILSWGAVLACHAAVKNKEGYYTARWFLGMMEAGMFPPDMSAIVGSLLAYGISYMKGLSGMSAWRWVYLSEGLATMLFGAVVFLALPDYPKSPRSRRWLTPREQEYLETRLSDNAPKTADPAFRKEEVVACLKDARTYAFMLAQSMTNFAGCGLSWILPTVTTDLGFAGLHRNQLLNIPPAAGSVLGVVFAGWFLKRAYITRPAFLILSGASMLVFFILLAVLKTNVGMYVAVTFGATFYGAAFGLAFQTQVGGVVAPQLFQSKFANNGYKTPFAVCAGAMAGAFLASWWAWWLTRYVESDVMRIRRLRAEAERKGEVYADDDVDASGSRRFAPTYT